jgi:hypothetical protein
VKDDTVRAELARLRASANEINQLKATFSTPPQPIDFEAYRAKIADKELVDLFEASCVGSGCWLGVASSCLVSSLCSVQNEYKSKKFPTLVYEELDDVKTGYAELVRSCAPWRPSTGGVTVAVPAAR